MREKREAARRAAEEVRAAKAQVAAEARAAKARAEEEARAAAKAAAAEARAKAAAIADKARAKAAMAAEQAQERDVVPWLRQLGFRADEACRAATFCETIPDAPLEERVRVALSYFHTRTSSHGWRRAANGVGTAA